MVMKQNKDYFDINNNKIYILNMSKKENKK